MVNIFQSLLLVIAGATQKDLARQVKYLKVENQILRSRLPKRIVCTPKERVRLIKFARNLGGKVLRQLTTIVAPETLLGWIRAEKKPKPQKRKRGRPNTPEQIRQLILLMARENQWGYTRIMGELKKLGIKPPSRNTVKSILKAAGYEPGPRRGEGTWDDFLKQHAASLWQCDFFSKRILTLKGIREVFVLAFIHVETRRVILSQSTFQPNEAWVVAQAAAFVEQARTQKLRVATVQRDRDTKFTKAVDQVLRSKRVKPKVNEFRSPNTNAFVERFVQSIQQECLDRFVIFGEKHMDHVCREYLEHYHSERPHQGIGIGNELLVRKHNLKPAEAILLNEIQCSERLGGLLKSYQRKAA
ncbi:Integrase core domain protein [Anatilimnocola aggregata]|uniref:Integrase core domain protein n=1 Tax=Anatilimnocola aggregata TaxID=2528021 RepID=A0A517YJ68_9BACT|nr:integrase core domain-containing protein [Anatilimnocola aggregata]QDU30261.1 Integrase core domain protein [Anatilimnocola aggregata]